MLPLVVAFLGLATPARAGQATGKPVSGYMAAFPAQQSGQLQEAEFTLDNVTVHVRTPFLPVGVQSTASPFTTSQPGASSQVANTSAPRPLRSLSIVAVPFGTRPPVEAVPVAEPGGAADYLQAMRAFRQGNELEFNAAGPVATLFGKKSTAQVSLLPLDDTNPASPALLLVEWVVEAGNRLWIVRAEHEQPTREVTIASLAPFLQSLEALELTSTTLDQPSTLNTAVGVPPNTLPGIPPTGAARNENSIATWALWVSGLALSLAGWGLFLRKRRTRGV